MSCDGLWVPQRDVEEQLATSTALFLTAAAYGVEPHARFKDDWRLNSSIAHAPQVLALLRRVPVGVECWCYSHGVTGLRQRFRAKLVRATVQHVIVKFLADEQGRTAALCLPAPLVQSVTVDEIAPLLPSDATATGGAPAAPTTALEAGGMGSEDDAERERRRNSSRLAGRLSLPLPSSSSSSPTTTPTTGPSAPLLPSLKPPSLNSTSSSGGNGDGPTWYPSASSDRNLLS
ncbi:hypothetical protein Ctob_014852 [Chrysochromulina tobinii]|uniref:Uncharacterized protein n=1 Tax=Chrysochromulina tobinii TaxID=1460289 RepID=A0A0M0K7V2_9EUKA|nr:hypothetical protein Ctob_014852 [Chrysochromulina tobinii]|eukprot:KOO34889.1 hypothetical protein Ctob_014852 [Chrysochromulina sp. CCMP291]